MTRLVIEPLGLHWLYTEEQGADLCAHAGVKVSRGDRIFVDTGPAGHAVSMGALHLLRTLERDFSNEGEWKRQLIPCCGHALVLDEKSGEVVNIGCSNGVGWHVRHQPDSFALQFENGDAIEVNGGEWRGAVASFSKQVRAFYFSEPRRAPEDAYDLAAFRAFVSEWDQRHNAALVWCANENRRSNPAVFFSKCRDA